MKKQKLLQILQREPHSTRENPDSLVSMWLYRSIKSVPADHSYVDFLHQNEDGSLSGLRLSQTTCKFIETDGGNERLSVEGPGEGIPLKGDVSDKMQRERRLLAEDFPELESVLSGEIDFQNLFSKPGSAKRAG